MNMSRNKIMDDLLKLDGAVTEKKNIHAEVIDTHSPWFNFSLGNGHGIPVGYSMLLYGPAKGGKSVICNSMIGRLHQADPEAWAIKYNTEFRENAQLDDQNRIMWGIGDNYQAYETNKPNEIFDAIAYKLPAIIENRKMKLRLVIIDSVNGIAGRRALNATTIDTQQIGDEAKTIQDGLKMIAPVQKKYGFALILTSHIRAQMDVVEQMRGRKVRPAVAFGLQHHCEYYVYVEPNQSKEGRVDMLGNAFVNDDVEDAKKKGEQTAHKIQCTVMDSSLGPKKRASEFTFHYTKGIINTHEEIFQMGINYGVIGRPNNRTYVYGDKQWGSKEAMLLAIRDDSNLYNEIHKELRVRDANKEFSVLPEKALINDTEE